MTDEDVTGTLRQRRFRKLLRALNDNDKGMSQAEIARRIGVSPGLVSQILLENKHAGEETIDKGKRALNIHEDFFSVEDLSPYTTHEPFVGGSPFRREPQPDVPAALEEYLAEREKGKRPVRAKVADRARASARSTGMATRTEAAALVDFLEGVVAREEAGEPPPERDPRNEIDQAAGQRVVERKKRTR